MKTRIEVNFFFYSDDSSNSYALQANDDIRDASGIFVRKLDRVAKIPSEDEPEPYPTTDDQWVRYSERIASVLAPATFKLVAALIKPELNSQQIERKKKHGTYEGSSDLSKIIKERSPLSSREYALSPVDSRLCIPFEPPKGGHKCYPRVIHAEIPFNPVIWSIDSANQLFQYEIRCVISFSPVP